MPTPLLNPSGSLEFLYRPASLVGLERLKTSLGSTDTFHLTTFPTPHWTLKSECTAKCLMAAAFHYIYEMAEYIKEKITVQACYLDIPPPPILI
ncbi:hypothetical protein AYI68_g2067 [Smittium mucronatum]|uniref:Uncharacterized protein n=1 Tax=Smittium mucronatum TaxID=133383 RepID=A0A1R0H3X4_9FUNG|nr:hypothetical protein AYI68_g2067 [Smittium mucronatum]